MPYSSTKLYQKTFYDKVKTRSYDRLLKEGLTAGTADPKESMLEKPYKSKTYSDMQQEYNPVLPPTVDPGVGTGGLKCTWVGTGCEQLIGCWAGSDLVITGPEAATAGYQIPTVTAGEIVKWTVSGSENRGLEIIMSGIPLRNTFTVRFKDGLGVIHEVPIDIVCPHGVGWSSNIIYAPGSWIDPISPRAFLGPTGLLYFVGINPNDGNIVYGFFDGSGWTTESVGTGEDYLDICLNSSDEPIIFSTRNVIYPDRKIIAIVKSGGTWTESDILTGIPNASVKYVFRDSSDYLHIFYSSSVIDQKFIYHATNSSGIWLTELLVTYTQDITWTAFDQGFSACIASDDTLHLIFTQSYTKESPTIYSSIVYHISGTYGSWSGVTTIVSRNTFIYSTASTCSVDNSDNIHLIFIDAIAVRYHLFTGSWSAGETITGSDATNALLGIVKGSDGIYYIDALNYSSILLEYKKIVSWTNTELDAIYGGYFGKVLYDYTNNIIHVVCSQSASLSEFTGGVYHYYRYL